MSTCKKLKFLRIASAMSQSTLAKKIGVHQTFVSKLEKGERKPSKETIKKLESALDAKLGSLFSD